MTSWFAQERRPFLIYSTLLFLLQLAYSLNSIDGQPLTGSRSFLPFGIYTVMTVLMVLAAKCASRFEDKDPEAFVNLLKVLSVLFAVEATISQTWFFYHIFHDTLFFRATYVSITAIAYIAASFALLGILRTLERRPGLAIYFILNAATLIGIGRLPVMWVAMALVMVASLLILRSSKSITGYALLGLAPLGIIGPLALWLFLKHRLTRVKSAARVCTIAYCSLAYLLSAIVITIGVLAAGSPLYYWGLKAGLTLPNFLDGLARGYVGWYDWHSPLIIFQAVLALIAVALVAKASAAGKDTLLYALLLLLTIGQIMWLNNYVLAAILLLPLATVFRSSAHLWLAFGLGAIQIARESHKDSPVYLIVVLLLFGILLIMQLRHAWKETGLFRTIELSEREITPKPFG